MRYLASEGNIHRTELVRLFTRYMGWLEKCAVLARLITDSYERGVNIVNVKDRTDLFAEANRVCGQGGWASKSGLGCLKMYSKDSLSVAVEANLTYTAE